MVPEDLPGNNPNLPGNSSRGGQRGQRGYEKRSFTHTIVGTKIFVLPGMEGGPTEKGLVHDLGADERNVWSPVSFGQEINVKASTVLSL